MATLDELQQQMEALRQRVDAITAPPTDYYTQRYSGEETDRGVEIALGLDPDGTGIVTPEHGGTGADTPQAALANLGAGVRPNLVLNSSLKVDQRGQTTYTSPSSATSFLSMLDGVSGKSATVTIENDGISFSVSKGTHVGQIRFLIPDGYIPNKVYQVSVLADITEAGPNTKIHIANHTTAITAGAALSISGPTNKKALFTFEWSYSAESSDPMSLEILAFEGTISGKIYGVKFEEGETQTLAYQDSNGDWQLLPQPDSDYATQLLKCQQFLFPIDGNGRYPATFGASANTVQVFIPTPIKMKSNPVVSGLTSISARVHTGAFNSAALSVSQTLLTEGGVLLILSCTFSSSVTPQSYACTNVVLGQRAFLISE